MTSFDGRRYQGRFDALARQGVDVHGEASLICGFKPGSVLDAGCGTGRVAIELARRGFDVVGVDVDASMLSEARRLAPELAWVEEDLSTLDLGRCFDIVMLAGNVPLFCPAPQRPALVERCAAHVATQGRLVAGFQLDRGYSLEEYDSCCRAAGLELESRWSTWGRSLWTGAEGYAVSVHRPASSASASASDAASDSASASGRTTDCSGRVPT